MKNLELAKEVIKSTTRFKLNQIEIRNEEEDEFRVYSTDSNSSMHCLDIIIGLSQIPCVYYYCEVDEKGKVYLSVF
jgi:hypothetical protein